jgi:hypothetical protein
MTEDQAPEAMEDELSALKQRADQMGIKYHPNIGVESLRERLAAVLADEAPAEEPPAPSGIPTPLSKAEQRVAAKKQATKLVRCRIACMNPSKREWEGEIFTAGNSLVGTFRKFVPFDKEFHVPHIILNMIKARQCQVFNTVRDSRDNQVRKGKLIKEFSVEVLPPLTEAEIKEIAQRQLMAAGTAV